MKKGSIFQPAMLVSGRVGFLKPLKYIEIHHLGCLSLRVMTSPIVMVQNLDIHQQYMGVEPKKVGKPQNGW